MSIELYGGILQFSRESGRVLIPEWMGNLRKYHVIFLLLVCFSLKVVMHYTISFVMVSDVIIFHEVLSWWCFNCVVTVLQYWCKWRGLDFCWTVTTIFRDTFALGQENYNFQRKIFFHFTCSKSRFLWKDTNRKYIQCYWFSHEFICGASIDNHRFEIGQISLILWKR